MQFPKHGNEQNIIKPRVKKLLTEHDWFWWSNQANGRGKSGISDLSAVRPGVFMVCETKYHREPTENQIGYLNSIKAAKHFAFLVNEKNIDQFEMFLNAFDTACALAAKRLPVGPDVGGPMLDCIKALTDYPLISAPNMSEGANNDATD